MRGPRITFAICVASPRSKGQRKIQRTGGGAQIVARTGLRCAWQVFQLEAEYPDAPGP